jgi:hypothetical protein
MSSLYNELALRESGLSYPVFEEAVTGYYNIQDGFKIKKAVLSIADFDKPSSEERLWVIDLGRKKLLYHCLVAHGKQTGENMAVKFSNEAKTSMSSLGFYITGGTYHGKNGFSMKLDGLDEGFNTNAMKRAIVLHGGWYVSKDFVKTYGRLGRSWGCPAVPKELVKGLIGDTANGSVFFIHKADSGYRSKYLDENQASQNFLKKRLE